MTSPWLSSRAVARSFSMLALLPAGLGLCLALADCSSDSTPTAGGGAGTSAAGAPGAAGAANPGGAPSVPLAGSDAGGGSGMVSAVAGSAGSATDAGGLENAAGAAAGGSDGGRGAAAGAVGSGAGTAGMSGSLGGASPGCAGKAYKFCEDFETGTVGALPTGWTAFRGAGPVLANDQAHSGKMALKSNTSATNSARAQRALSAIGATASAHWGRLFYKVQTPPPIPMNSGQVLHVTFASLFQGMSEHSRVVDTVENSNRKHQYLYNLPSDQCSKGSSYDYTYDGMWHCAEWHIDAAVGSFQFFIDSKEVTSIGFTGNTGANGKCDAMIPKTDVSLSLGETFYQVPTTPLVSWIDDVALDDTQVHCQ